jgi:hypothetical protein
VITDEECLVKRVPVPRQDATQYHSRARSLLIHILLCHSLIH